MNFEAFTTKKLPSGGTLRVINRVTTPEFNYSHPIAIYTPPDLIAPKKMILYIHGHRGICETNTATIESMLKTFNITNAIDAHAKDAILVFPQSSGKCSNFDVELAPKVEAFRKWLSPYSDLPCILAGHSGAYRCMSNMLKSDELCKKLMGAILLDAMYSDSSFYITSWRHAGILNHQMKVFAVWRDGGDTHEGSKAVQAAMPENKVELIESSTQEHCKVPNVYLGELLRRIQLG